VKKSAGNVQSGFEDFFVCKRVVTKAAGKFAGNEKSAENAAGNCFIYFKKIMQSMHFRTIKI